MSNAIMGACDRCGGNPEKLRMSKPGGGWSVDVCGRCARVLDRRGWTRDKVYTETEAERVRRCGRY